MTEVPHKFIQIAASEHLYALDQNGDVWSTPARVRAGSGSASVGSEIRLG
jgi:cytochrome c-type biogenesis protein CcmE